MPALTATEARDRFATARVARLATAAADGTPHVVPVVFALRASVIEIAVDAKPKRSPALRRLRNLAENPRASLLVDHYAEDWTTLWWARADGRAEILETPETEPEGRAALARLAERYPQQTVTGALIRVEITRFSGWRAA